MKSVRNSNKSWRSALIFLVIVGLVALLINAFVYLPKDVPAPKPKVTDYSTPDAWR